MIADTNIKRPALRYYGGKWDLAPWIISHFPPHKNYVEPCGGAASVLLQKPRSPLETYNDLDSNVVNFFRILRDRPDDLIRKIRLTPWARKEYEHSLETTQDDLENARRFWCWAWMGIGGKWGGWRAITDSKSRNGCAWPTDTIDIFHLEVVAERLQRVQIDCDVDLHVVQRYDNDDVLIYFDPPYISDTRERAGRYECDYTDQDHIAAASLLRSCSGYVIVSGYACPLYTELYEAHGWSRVDKEAQTNSGGKRIESLWLSPRTVEALNMPQQVSMPL